MDLTWGPSTEDVSLEGGEDLEGCVESSGMLVTCEYSWIMYANTTGRWLVTTTYRDRAESVSLSPEVLADPDLQQAVVAIGDRATENFGQVVPADNLRPRDPRDVEVSATAPNGTTCTEGEPVQGVRSSRVHMDVCTTATEHFLEGTVDGRPFRGEATGWPYDACAGDPDFRLDEAEISLCISIFGVTVGSVEPRLELFSEYLDSAWGYDVDPSGPDGP